MPGTVQLETSRLRLTFNRENGSLIGIYSKVSNWEVIQREHLGLSWKIMLPLEGRRDNVAWGHQQPLPPVCEASDTQVVFLWNGVVSEFGGESPVQIKATCEIVEDQAVFRMHIENHSQLVVENVYYPYIGDLHRPENCEQMSFQYGEYIHVAKFELYPTFENPVGTHGTDYPTLALRPEHCNPPMNPYGLISDQAGNGLYLGVAERRMTPVVWHAEALPGWRNSLDSRLFDEDEVDGKEVYVRFAAGHLPFIMPGGSYDLLPFALDAYKGDWTDGVDCYTKTSRRWNHLPAQMPAWAKEPHSWLQIHINSPEDELRIPFKELPKIGAECKKYGVEAIQLVGWNDGGQDRGNPCHDPDPRLGTFEELKQAIAEIQAMGIKLILFTKFVWAEQSKEDFKEIYEPLAIKDPYGDHYLHPGYQYMTLTQVANVNTRRLVPMCFGSETYREICNREFQKCVDLGADGMLFDECLHHMPTLCCFDTSHGHRYGVSSFRYDEELIEGFRERVKDRDFLIAGEGIYDFQHNYYDLSYARTFGRDHKPGARYMRPDGQIMTAVIGFNDRNMINQCLMNRYIISYEPYNFKGMLSDFPRTVAYGKQMDCLRTELRKWFWDGKYCDKRGAVAEIAGGKLLEHYSVFTAEDGTQGMVLCNYDENKTIRVRPTLSSGQALRYCRLIDEPAGKPLNGWVDIPPCSAAVVY